MNTATSVILIALLIAAGVFVSKRLLPGPVDKNQDDTQARLIPIASIAELELLFSASSATPTLLFLHDPSCPISRAAYRQVMRLDMAIPLIDVRQARDLTRAVEEYTGVRHESPQAIVLGKDRAVWSASHYAITTEAVANACRQVNEDVPVIG